MLILPEGDLQIERLTALLSGRNISTTGSICEIEHEIYCREPRFKALVKDGDAAFLAIAPYNHSPLAYRFLQELFDQAEKNSNRLFRRTLQPVRVTCKGLIIYDPSSTSTLVECYARIFSRIHTDNIG